MPPHRTPTLGGSADETEEGGFRYKLACHGGPRGDSGPDCVACFVFLGSILICWLYILTHPDLAQVRGELSYLAPLGSENISALFKQCFIRGGVSPPDWIKHHASQSQDRNNKYFILYIEFCINNKI